MSGGGTWLDVTNWRERMRRLRPRWASSPTSKGVPLDDGPKQPYYITVGNGGPFGFAGLWDTTPANP